jgi:hypothetical protein
MLRRLVLGALALTLGGSGLAQVAAQADYSTTPVLAGSWGYQALAGGSEARFVDTRGIAQLTIGCNRSTRQVAIARASGTGATALQLWTSNAQRLLPARFDPRGMRIVADVPASDALLDALAFSRGRVAVNVVGGSVLVVPAWPEAARIVEDCRI